jgi:hypothetical protein
MKTQVAFALIMVSAVVAQTNTTLPQFKNKFLPCVAASTKNVYCTDGTCYNNITNPATPNLFNKATRCSNNFNADIYDTAYPVSYDKSTPVFPITKLEHIEVGSLKL